MTQPGLLELAKQGDPQAIATLMNRQIQAKGILAKANTVKGCLKIIFEATEAPPQQALATYTYNAISKLEAPSLEKVIIYGKQTGNDFPVWQQEFNLLNTPFLDNNRLEPPSSRAITQSVPKDIIIFECNGNAKTLVITTEGVVIKKIGASLSAPTNEVNFIPYTSIINIQLISSSIFNGFIYFQVVGLPENIQFVDAASNLNTVAFIHDKFNEFETAKLLVSEKTDLQKKQTYTETVLVAQPTHTVVQPVIQQNSEIQVRCPKCSSTQISANKKGFNIGQALVGGVASFGVGVVAGLWGSNEIRLNCLRCGHRWKPGR